VEPTGRPRWQNSVKRALTASRRSRWQAGDAARASIGGKVWTWEKKTSLAPCSVVGSEFPGAYLTIPNILGSDSIRLRVRPRPALRFVSVRGSGSWQESKLLPKGRGYQSFGAMSCTAGCW